MQPYTTVQTPNAGQLTLKISRELDGKRLFITITEAGNEEELRHPNAELLEAIVSTPTFAEEELQGFDEAINHLNRWRGK